jgi:predicted nucleic acid-binding protein
MRLRQGEAVFVDSGAWIALALSRDRLHAPAREQWDRLRGAGAKLHTSVPVVVETFTFLDRNANRDVALTWKESICAPGTVDILPCGLRDLEQSLAYFRRADLYKLSAVDATIQTGDIAAHELRQGMSVVCPRRQSKRLQNHAAPTTTSRKSRHRPKR